MPDHTWVEAVLKDLGRYAEQNELKRLQELIENARAVAKQEIANSRVVMPNIAQTKISSGDRRLK